MDERKINKNDTGIIGSDKQNLSGDRGIKSVNPEVGKAGGNGKADGAGAGASPGSSPSTGAGAGAGTGAGKTKEEKPLELAFLTEKDKEEKVKKKKKKEPVISVTENFKSLLTGVFTITGNINPVWSVQESEIDLVVEPASRLFERYISEKAEETSDIVALVVALSILLVPRIILSISSKKEKGEVKYEQKREVQSSNSGSLPKFANSISGAGDFAS